MDVGRPERILAGTVTQFRLHMAGKAARRVPSRTGEGERYCALCKEEGKPRETARDFVTIRPKEGGSPMRVPLCVAHREGLGKTSSLYELVAPPARAVPAKGQARQALHVEGKSEKGNISRTLRRAERYSKGQRGRLGE